ncbi:hypothetical protein [Actinomycetospora flava]|uniref:Uncharacterized protein n=1 Tax=Actinomycetospora flava TaxID=3129232 RepID=A0ABU8M5Y5_9PSEU
MGDNEPGLVRFSAFTMHLTYGYDDYALVLELRARPPDYKPILMVTGWGEPVARRATIRTFDDDTSLGVAREVLAFSRSELREEIRRAGLDPGAVDTSALDPGVAEQETLSRETTDPARRPGLDFLDEDTGDVLAAMWLSNVGEPSEIRVPVRYEMELRSFDAMAAQAERLLGSGSSTF